MGQWIDPDCEAVDPFDRSLTVPGLKSFKNNIEDDDQTGDNEDADQNHIQKRQIAQSGQFARNGEIKGDE